MTPARPLLVTRHQPRHTYATSLANSGMSLQALMVLLGHRSPDMTKGYATLLTLAYPRRTSRRNVG